jgi:hypothetical protein
MTGALSVLSSVSDIIGPEHQRLAIPKLHEEVQCITYRKSKATLWIYGIRIARPRYIAQTANALATKAAVVLFGPQLVGKTTLTRDFIDEAPNVQYLDLERESDLRKLDDAGEFTIELKRSTTPKMPPVLTIAADDIGAKRRILIRGGHDSYVAGNGVEVMPLAAAIEIVSTP